jgi:hypothetical protein
LPDGASAFFSKTGIEPPDRIEAAREMSFSAQRPEQTSTQPSWLFTHLAKVEVGLWSKNWID